MHLSLIDALAACVGKLGSVQAYELSTRGALLNYLRRHCRSVATSEYLDGVVPGETRGGIRCEDVQRLSFADASFDLCTSTEVFEHVPDDRAGLRELHRVLKPRGHLLFTVPLTGNQVTLERARLDDGRIVHMQPPTFHGDRLGGPGSVLVYRDYGQDILERVRECGFDHVRLWTPQHAFMGHTRGVIVARKSG